VKERRRWSVMHVVRYILRGRGRGRGRRGGHWRGIACNTRVDSKVILQLFSVCVWAHFKSFGLKFVPVNGMNEKEL
jgi:hypothetical protein